MKTFTLITGASAGIGKATACLLAQNKKNLILIARRKDRLDRLKDALEKKYEVEVLTYQVDLSDQQQIQDFFETIKSIPVDTLINNAGLALGKSSFEDYGWADFDRMIDINIKAFTRVGQLAIPMIKKHQGHIINISSIAGTEAYEGGSVYCGTKAYVKMISKALRIDLHGTGVRVTDIAPGAVETEFSDVRFKGDLDTAKNTYKGYTPLFATDIAETIWFALSRPKSVNIEYMLVMPTAQASATRFFKK